jgi:hypothetical protein
MLLGPEYGLVFVIKYPTLMRCLPQMAPTASHEYLCCLLRVPVLPSMSTRCLPRPPQLRGPLKEVPELASLEGTKISSVIPWGVPGGTWEGTKIAFVMALGSRSSPGILDE